MQIKKRLERLEQEYLEKPRIPGLYLLSEFRFIGAFDKKYHGREESAPLILRREYDSLTKGREQTQPSAEPCALKPKQGDAHDGIAARSSQTVDPGGKRKERP